MLEDAISRIHTMLKNQESRHPMTRDALGKLYSDIAGLRDFVNKEIDLIEIDKVLSGKEKKFEKRKILERAQRELEEIKENRDYSNLVKELEIKMLGSYEREEISISRALQEKEVRDRLFGLTEKQILDRFKHDLFQGTNPLLIDAILNAPAGFEPLSERVCKRLRIVRAKQSNPELANELKALSELNAAITHLFSLIKKELDIRRRKELPETVSKKIQ